MNIFSTHLGSEFSNLNPLLQDVHSGRKNLDGIVEVKRGGILAKIICSVFRFPKENSNTHLKVECNHNDENMEWVRYFDGFKMRSVFVSEGEYLIEKLGPLSLYFKAHVENGNLEYKFSKTKFLGVPMPRILSPKIKAGEKETNGSYEFYVSVSMFLIGFVLSYCGNLAISSGEN